MKTNTNQNTPTLTERVEKIDIIKRYTSACVGNSIDHSSRGNGNRAARRSGKTVRAQITR